MHMNSFHFGNGEKQCDHDTCSKATTDEIYFVIYRDVSQNKIKLLQLDAQ